MSKKFGKFLLFSAVAGAAAYGAYQYLQKKDKITPAGTAEEPDEDFDDFSEDLDEDVNTSKERSAGEGNRQSRDRRANRFGR